MMVTASLSCQTYLHAVFVTLLLVGAVQQASSVKVLEGQARVVDGDTLWIGNNKVRLYGIDAPEKTQSCKDAKGQAYACGKASTDALTQKVGKGPIRCEVKDVDQYGRNVAACSTKPATPAAQPEDINGFMVMNGHATAYRGITRQYVPQEDRAKIQKKGVWQGTFQRPSDYRKQQNIAEGEQQQQPPRPQQPAAPMRPQQGLQPQPAQPAASSVGAGTGTRPSYAAVLGGH